MFLFTIVNYRRAYINKEGAPIEALKRPSGQAAWRARQGEHRGAPCRYKQMHLSHRDVKNCSQVTVVGAPTQCVRLSPESMLQRLRLNRIWKTTIKNKVTDQNGLNEETISNFTHVYFIPLYSFPRHVCSQLTLHRFINEQHFNI